MKITSALDSVFSAQSPSDLYDEIYGSGENGTRHFSVDPLDESDHHQITIGVKRGPDTNFDNEDAQKFGPRHGFEFTIAHNGEPIYHSKNFRGPARSYIPNYDEHDAAAYIIDSVNSDVAFGQDEPEEYAAGGSTLEQDYPKRFINFVNDHADRLYTGGYKDRIREIQ